MGWYCASSPTLNGFYASIVVYMDTVIQEFLARPAAELTALVHERKQILTANPDQLLPAARHLVDNGRAISAILLLEVGLVRGAFPAPSAQQFLQVAAPAISNVRQQHVELCRKEFLAVCRGVKQVCLDASNPKGAIAPLMRALAAFQPGPGWLTPLHADICQLCLLSKVYNAAAPLLEEDYYDVDPRKTLLEPKDVLLFSYYGGMICTGRKLYSRAISVYLVALTAPTQVLSAVTSAVYRKYILVCLLEHGELQQLPKYVSSQSIRALKQDGELYHKIAQAFCNKSMEEFLGLLQQSQPTLTQEGNWGLSQLLLASKQQRSVSNLTRTFLTLALSDIASNAGLPSAAAAEQAIVRMAAKGDISAKISSLNGMARFEDEVPSGGSGEPLGASAASEKLQQLLQQLVALDARVADINHSVSCDQQYVVQQSGGRKSAATANAAVHGLVDDQLVDGMDAMADLLGSA